jgi:uncharacterized membrane-anchored protein YhcB (DUF1043 family)
MALKGPVKHHDQLTRPQGENLARTFGVGALVIALVVGIQIGSIPWRYRRQIWQAQGFLLGALVGYVLGRLNETPRAKGD